MKYFFLLLTSLTFSLTSFAAKKHKLTITVASLFDNTVLEGIDVSIKRDQRIIPVGKTDAYGTIQVDHFPKQFIKLLLKDPRMKYDQRIVTINKSEIKNQQEVVKLKYAVAYENKLFQDIDEKYGEETKSFILSQQLNSSADSTNFQAAQYKTGINELLQFLAKNVDFPEECAEFGIEGKVFISFMVQKDGQVSHVKLLNGAHPLMNEEALRVIRYTKIWTPARRNNVPVQSAFTIPISFTF